MFQNIPGKPMASENEDALLKVKIGVEGVLECVSCRTLPVKGTPVFSCQQQHILCTECNKVSISPTFYEHIFHMKVF